MRRIRKGSSINTRSRVSHGTDRCRSRRSNKKGRHKSRPSNLNEADLLAHRLAGLGSAFEHLHAHHMDRVLVRVYMSAQLRMVTVMGLQFFGIHHVPALAILIVYELY